MGILKDLYFGKVYPYEHRESKSELAEVRMQVLQCEQAVTERFTTPEDKELLEKYKASLTELSTLESLDSFQRGFRLGARIMLEINESTE